MSIQFSILFPLLLLFQKLCWHNSSSKLQLYMWCSICVSSVIFVQCASHLFHLFLCRTWTMEGENITNCNMKFTNCLYSYPCSIWRYFIILYVCMHEIVLLTKKGSDILFLMTTSQCSSDSLEWRHTIVGYQRIIYNHFTLTLFFEM